MELIEKALAKARAEASSRPEIRARGAIAPTADTGEAEADPLIGIRYSKTRVEPTNLEIWREHRLVAANSQDAVADVFRMLRTKVLQAMKEHGWRTLAIVGATAGVGKSTIAANLALSIALDANQTVLLVDADLRKPRVASYFGLSPELGLGDYLMRDLPLQDVLLNPGVERLVLLPSRGSYSTSTELLGSKKMQALVPDLKRRYEDRIVIFDLPPLLASGDALGFLPSFDCALMVIEDGGNTASELSEARRMLDQVELLGWVLNKGEAGTSSYYYQHYGAADGS